MSRMADNGEEQKNVPAREIKSNWYNENEDKQNYALSLMIV